MHQFARWLLGRLKRTSSTLAKARSEIAGAPATDYASRIAAEREIFAGQTEVHDLPAIFHYWSNLYLRPYVRSLVTCIGGR